MSVQAENVPVPSASEDELDDNHSLEANQATDSKSVSSRNQSVSSVVDMESDSMNDDNNSNSARGPDSSRASTLREADADTVSHRSIDRDALAEYMIRRGARVDEPEREEDGGLNLTNKYLYKLIASDKRLYYHTPELNEKLYLHYKGFHTIKNLEQFTDLKCLYFEGNGCKKLEGLEKCTKLRCFFVQENAIEKMEGLDTLTDLR